MKCKMELMWKNENKFNHCGEVCQSHRSPFMNEWIIVFVYSKMNKLPRILISSQFFQVSICTNVINIQMFIRIKLSIKLSVLHVYMFGGNNDQTGGLTDYWHQTCMIDRKQFSGWILADKRCLTSRPRIWRPPPLPPLPLLQQSYVIFSKWMSASFN